MGGFRAPRRMGYGSRRIAFRREGDRMGRRLIFDWRYAIMGLQNDGSKAILPSAQKPRGRREGEGTK